MDSHAADYEGAWPDYGPQAAGDLGLEDTRPPADVAGDHGLEYQIESTYTSSNGDALYEVGHRSGVPDRSHSDSAPPQPAGHELSPPLTRSGSSDQQCAPEPSAIRPSHSSSDLLSSSQAPSSTAHARPARASRARTGSTSNLHSAAHGMSRRSALQQHPRHAGSHNSSRQGRGASVPRPPARTHSRAVLTDAPPAKGKGAPVALSTSTLGTVVRGPLPPLADAVSAPPAPALKPSHNPASAIVGMLPGITHAKQRSASTAATNGIPAAPPRRMALVPAQKLDPKQLKEAVRRWYQFDAVGKVTIVQAGKAELTRALGVHSRDLRILDINTAYPSCILCRERALVVNLEYIQVIVTMDTTLVLNAERANEPQVVSFVEDLQRRLAGETGGGGNGSGAVGSVAAGGCGKEAAEELPPEGPLRDVAQAEVAAAMANSAREAHAHGEAMPYELKVLELCLDHVAQYMAEQVRQLEERSTAALEALTARVNAGTLERVRRVKNLMVRLGARVETIRGLLEKYLGDDDDLAELHLTGQRQLEREYAERVRQREERRLERLERYEEKRRRRIADDPAASEPSSVSNSTFSLSDEDTGWLSSQAEMVLEPYFMSFDNSWSRLQAIGEFIDDTEDFINITLDSHRNQLIQVDLLLTAASFAIGLVTLIAGIFGMNLATGFESSSLAFALISVLSVALAVGLLLGFVFIMRQKRLAFV